MVFSSVPFLFFFFAILLFLYWVLHKNTIRNVLLLVASLLFYAWGEPIYILLLIASVFFNWLIALFMVKQPRRDKFWVAVAVVLNIALLVIFKYSGFMVESINAVLSLQLPVPQIRLPIGISFFTFQALSYVIDVYRDRKNVQHNFFYLLLYVSFFPQLIAGPIVKYHDISEQLKERAFTIDGFTFGMRRFLYGLGKKVLLSNTLAIVADTAFSTDTALLTTPLAWLAALAYMLQIYYDFSGYSDMAIGLGHIFGFDFKENFDYPYAARGIKLFWRRWHISLSTWFKEYLYIPLGGNRKGKARALCNQLIVFAATGLWHGANVTFLLWGLFHGLFLILESSQIIPINRIVKNPVGKAFTHVYTWFVVLIGFTLFRADSVSYALSFFKVMFTGGAAGNASLWAQFTPWFVFVMFVAVVFAFPIFPVLRKKLCANLRIKPVYTAISYAFSFMLLLLCMGALAANTYNPFIYFRF